MTYPMMHLMLPISLPPPSDNRQTPVKTLPYRNLFAGGNYQVAITVDFRD